jgi:SAM-dependent methyltransferase/vacuolar-type H+-ATPase subunit H
MSKFFPTIYMHDFFNARDLIPSNESSQSIEIPDDDFEIVTVIKPHKLFVRLALKHREAILKNPVLRRMAMRAKSKYYVRNAPVTMTYFNAEKYFTLSYIDFIHVMYQKLLGREADNIGLDAYTRYYRRGGNKEAIIYSIYNSKEFSNRFKIKNIERYKKVYKKCRLKMLLRRLPFIGTYVRLKAADRLMADMHDIIHHKYAHSIAHTDAVRAITAQEVAVVRNNTEQQINTFRDDMTREVSEIRDNTTQEIYAIQDKTEKKISSLHEDTTCEIAEIRESTSQGLTEARDSLTWSVAKIHENVTKEIATVCSEIRIEADKNTEHMVASVRDDIKQDILTIQDRTEKKISSLHEGTTREIAEIRESASQGFTEARDSLTWSVEKVHENVTKEIATVCSEIRIEVDKNTEHMVASVRDDMAQEIGSARSRTDNLYSIFEPYLDTVKEILPQTMTIKSIFEDDSYLSKASQNLSVEEVKFLSSCSFDDKFNFYMAKLFRGEEKTLFDVFDNYLEPVTKAINKSKCNTVIDLGCGKGDWMRYLNKHGIIAEGVDINKASAQFAIDSGFDVAIDDINKYLEKQPDKSVAVISLLAVSEHLTHKEFKEVLINVSRVIADGGVFIMDAPNPYCYFHYGGFYTDPSHITWVSPEPTKLLLEMVGFGNINVIYYAPYEWLTKSPEKTYNYQAFGVIAEKGKQ